MPSSGTLRSQPPKIGIQYPNRMVSPLRRVMWVDHGVSS
jgi:hypothetical protein